MKLYAYECFGGCSGELGQVFACLAAVCVWSLNLLGERQLQPGGVSVNGPAFTRAPGSPNKRAEPIRKQRWNAGWTTALTLLPLYNNCCLLFSYWQLAGGFVCQPTRKSSSSGCATADPQIRHLSACHDNECVMERNCWGHPRSAYVLNKPDVSALTLLSTAHVTVNCGWTSRSRM